jgi:hypothetical protein
VIASSTNVLLASVAAGSERLVRFNADFVDGGHSISARHHGCA